MRVGLRKLLVVGSASTLVGCTAAPATADRPGTMPLLPAGYSWAQNPALPPGGQLAALAGNPQAPGLYAFRALIPADLRIMPHTHPEDRIYTVLVGTWYIGLGAEYDPARLQGFGPGSVYVLPAGTAHVHWARGGRAVVQVTGIGPTATTYLRPEDDPRNR